MADREDDSTSNEPDELKLWMRLIAARDSLLVEHEKFSATEHPVRQHERLMIELHGSSGRTERHLQEADRLAKERAETAKKRLNELDFWINDTTRWKADVRGRTLKQLEDQVGLLERIDAKQKATDAIGSWLTDRNDKNKRLEAALWLWRYEHSMPRSTPSDLLSMKKRLESLEETDRESRVDESNIAARRAGRIVKGVE